jgi:predicted ATP-grasp superfamily ATP-dependent carboligase
LDPTDLYELDADLPELTKPVLVVALPGFVDAGAAGRLLGRQLMDRLPHRPIATFDADQLIDHRSHRPIMTFVEDHWESYTPHVLAVHLMRDEASEPFLFLTGPEPDYQWERFTTAMLGLIERFDIRLTVGINAIPMAVPHTRPTGLTAHATRPELIAGYEPWLATVQVPGSVGALMEFRLGEAGQEAMGFAVHVPHYLAQAEYPDAADVLLDAIARATGLVLPRAELRTAAEETRGKIDEQVGRSDEVAAIVRALEQQYDAYTAGSRGQASLLTVDRESLPTADELGAELERFLAEQTHNDEPSED